MNLKIIDLSKIKGRKEELQKIKRYIHHITKIMFYRTNDYLHSRRVLGHIEEMIPDIKKFYGKDFDIEFARTLALVHDDVEILTGDIQLHDKEQMNEEEQNKLAKEEEQSIPKMIERFGKKINGFSYKKLLFSAKRKDRIEAQFVSFCDKFDGAGEAWNEVFAGNHYFLRPAGGNQGKNGGYIRRLNDFPKKYPLMKPFFEKHPEYLPKPFDFPKIVKNRKPHTKESLKENTGYKPYERWKKTVMKKEKTNNITIQTEFLQK